MKRGTRMLALLLAVVMAVSMLPAAAAAGFERSQTWNSNQFTDVTTDHWFYDTVKGAFELGLMNGDPDGSFRPEGQVTLAETVTVASRIHAIANLGKEEFEQGEVWYEVYVAYALQNGILEQELGNYSRAATRLEFAEILSRALPEEDLKAINTVEDGAIPDVKDNAAVYSLYRAGVLTGNDEQGTFAPQSSIKRSEVAAIVARMALPELRREITLEADGETLGGLSSFTPGETVDPEDYIDENNALTQPFDVVYPEIFESGAVEYSGEQIMIKLAADTGLSAGLRAAGVTSMEKIMEISSGVWYKAYVSGEVETVMAAVRQVDGVLVAEYDFAYETMAIADCKPEDVDKEVHKNKDYADQWYLCSCGIQKGWGHLKHHHHHGPKPEDTDNGDENVGIAGEGVVVAVIDTGVDYTHEDLKDSMWVNTDEIPDNGIDDDKNGYVDDYYGYNAVAGKGSANDDNGHGTHVAGIIAAADNNLGIVGIAYNAKIMAVKAGMASGYFNNSDIAEAIIYAHDNGADVINMSFGGSAVSIAVTDALEYAYTNCVLVASAGNDGVPNEPQKGWVGDVIPNYPAALSYVLGVMSVDENGVESSFTNWDVNAFNSVEYELYAPGESMLSTIPGNRYAKWNGTSMAAPVVSAMAALLRAEFYDRGAYPTKFIYGQLSGTGTQSASCCDSKHGIHNLPKIVDLYQAMTVLPKPEVGVSDYVIFDTPGLQGNEKNNGDGVIDAGETIAIGFTLRNRWGKTGDTVVSVDTLSQAGIADPYVTIVNNDVSYGSVGTYSTQNAGWIKDADGAYIGWEKPIYLQIAADCPNDYIVKLNVTTSSTNGLDAADETVYQSMPVSFNLDVRRGTILPNKIEEDMILTAEDLYIIDNTTTIFAGATVTVQPGARIQFWADDEEGAYAQKNLVSLKVEGTLLFEGTEKEPIEVYPSERFSDYQVEIYESGSGLIKMRHTNVVNPVLDISYAENCEFSQNYRNMKLSYRYLSGGTVYDRYNYNKPEINLIEADSCAYYKLGPAAVSTGRHDGCIFVDSAMDFRGTYENCVFYGNNNYLGEEKGAKSTLTVPGTTGIFGLTSTYCPYHIFTNEETGTTYMQLGTGSILTGGTNVRLMQAFGEYLGGHLAYFETQEEFEFVKAQIKKDDSVLGIQRDEDSGQWAWMDGTPVGDFLSIGTSTDKQAYVTWSGGNSVYVRNSSGGTSGYYLLEIPGIALEEASVILYLGDTGYQIKPCTELKKLQYHSTDETVAVVDETGFVVPKGIGEAEIIVSSDVGLSNAVIKVSVREYVAMTSMELGDDLDMMKGETYQLLPVTTPADHTETLIYSSSDEGVAVVDDDGHVVAVGPGEAVITAVCKTNELISDSIVVTVEVPIGAIESKQSLYVVGIDAEESAEDVFDLIFTPADTTFTDLFWESSNPEIIYVNEDGKLVKLKPGFATLRATVVGTDLFTELQVVVIEKAITPEVIQMDSNVGNIALLSDGTMWYWNNDSDASVPEKLALENVAQFAAGRCRLGANAAVNSLCILTLDQNGNLNCWKGDASNPQAPLSLYNDILGTENGAPLTGVKQIVTVGSETFLILMETGDVWGFGSNGSYQLGDGTTISKQVTMAQVPVENVVQIAGSDDSYAVYLHADGTASMTGCAYNRKTGETKRAEYPVQVAENVSALMETQAEVLLEYADGNYGWVFGDTEIRKMGDSFFTDGELGLPYNDPFFIYLEDGYAYVKGEDRGIGKGGVGKLSSSTIQEWTRVHNVADVENVFSLWNATYFQTADGFYGTGLAIPNQSTSYLYVPEMIHFGITVPEDGPALLETNLDGVVQVDDALVIRFTQSLVASKMGGILLTDSQGNHVTVLREVRLEKLTITPFTDLVSGETYTLTIPASAFMNAFNLPNEAVTLTFTVAEEQPAEVMMMSLDMAEPETPLEWTAELVETCWESFLNEGTSIYFRNNAVLNRTDRQDQMETHWLRIVGASASTYSEHPLSGNYWGTVSSEMIDHQISDFDDYNTLVDVHEGDFLTTAPENVWPFAVKAGLLDKDGNEVEVVGNETLTFYVDFNRDMDTAIELDVRFGSTYPYADYAVEGRWVNARRWEGTTTLNTLIEGGYQYWSIDNGRAADAPLKLYKDWGRFQFEIDTTAAQALILQGSATEEGVLLTWYQDDFDTLAGYNVYRAKGSEDAQYTRLNPTIIPADTRSFLDDNVEPGVVYYYNFTVVKTDMAESEPSGRTRVLSKDTIPPKLIHTPVNVGTVGRNLTISATVTDNLSLNRVTLFYRTAGEAEWKSVDMTNLNDKYSAIVAGNVLDPAGLEYYIEAFDGVSCAYKGTADAPYTVTIRAQAGSDAKGDFDGDGTISILDAYQILQAASGRLNADADQFSRADLNSDGLLTAAEALTVLKYVNGEIGSLQQS